MIILAAKINTNRIELGQTDVYGFTISSASNAGEFIPVNNLSINTDNLTVQEAELVNAFVDLMKVKLAG